MANFIREAIVPVAVTGAIGAGTVFSLKKARAVYEASGAPAAKAAYEAELLRAYQHAYPNDSHVMIDELQSFERTVGGLDETYRYSNFELQNDVYKSQVELYGSPQGTLLELKAHYLELASQNDLWDALSALGVMGIIVGTFVSFISIGEYIEKKRYGYY